MNHELFDDTIGLSTNSSKPAFVVGVTGHMDLDPARRDRVKAEVKRIFAWLRLSSCDRHQNIGEPSLGPGLDLKDTPIILLSSLAPGADQWVAEAALEMDPPLRVLAPLPFFKDQYLEASTFIKNGVTIDQAASRFLAEFPDPDVFVVRLVDEIGLDDDALRAKHKAILTGQEGKQERDRRYAAAGEYVAAYSDILIALTDKPIGEAENAALNPSVDQGARAVAELKRRGVTPGLLPILPTLSWADNGPVIHLYTPRKTEQAVGSRNNERGAKVKSLEVLYPYDCRPPGVSEQENDHPEWQKAGYALLKVVSEHLQRLNTENIRVDPAREEGAFLEMLPALPDTSARTARTHALPTASEHFQATLDRIARLRRRIADYSTYYNAHLSRLKRALFALAFGSALFFALADNWDGKDIGLPLPQAFFVTALGLTLAAWIVYFSFKKTGAADRCEDYRAIAEGLRVQFYWTACGSGESVASSYLQRQRGELGWIRNVISATAFPFEPNRVRFNLLSAGDQLAALQSIRKIWIGGQCAYFKKTTSDLDLRRELFSTYARVLLWTGFILFTFFFFFAQSPNPAGFARLFGLLFFAAGALILALLYRESITSPGHGAKNEKTEREQSDRTPEELVDEIQKWLLSFPDKLLPKRIRSLKGGHLILNTLLVIAFSLIAIGSINFLEGLAPWLPSTYKFGSIFKYLALAGGVLCGAWVEVNFFSEHIRHYASMASLFQAAGLRFDDYFSWAGQAASAGQDGVEKQVIANIQGLIVAVGREALAENAEWLITHRARPLEPVSV
jgi:hypothetical protein